MTDFISLLNNESIDPTREPEILRAMLDALLYAHVPSSDDSSRLRFLQFIRPDNGKTVLPIFSDKEKADEAAAGDARVMCMTGRELLSVTLGATLMLDPNQRDCVFYPEEIEALLRDGSAGIAIPCRIEENTQVIASRPRKVPIRMASALRKIYSKMDAVRSAYLTVVRWEHSRLYPTLFIAVIVDRNERERVLRATVAAIQPHITEPGLSIDVAAVDPDEECSHPFAKGMRIYRRN